MRSQKLSKLGNSCGHNCFFMAISAPVTVAVGGRWQEIEDANHRLSRDLALAEEDAVSHKLLGCS